MEVFRDPGLRAIGLKVVVTVGLLGFVAPAWRAAAQEQELTPVEAGRQLVVRLGCPGCHTIGDPAFTGLGPSGPDLRRVASKISVGWTYQWLLAPRDLQPTTSMPHFFDDADPAEVRAVVAYLGASSQPVDYPPPPAGDAVRGAELFDSVGCTGCHLRETATERHGEAEPYRQAGPNLLHLGSKVDAAWLFAWLKDPKQYAPETKMPDLRLADREAADLTAFLMASRDPGQEDAELPSAGEDDVEAGREAIALYGCYGCHRIAGFEDAEKHAGELDSAEGFSGHGMTGLPDFGLAAREAEAIRAAIGSAEALTAITAGRKLVRQYGCRGCHLIEGRGQAIRATIDDAGMLPPSLQSEGSRVQPEWLATFLDDSGSVVLRPWLTVRMPTFGFSEEEVRVAVAYFSALEERELASSPAEPLAARSLALGREAFDLLECARCHPAGAEAAAALGAAPADLAPSLEIAGRRLRYEWISSWIKDPQSWLPGTRMPTYFFPSRSGVFSSPFANAFDAPELEEPKARLMEHFGSEDELEAVLNDADALIAALRDYIWSLEEGGPDG